MIFVTAHVSPIQGPVQALETYLTDQKLDFVIAKHDLYSNSPFAYIKDFLSNIVKAFRIKGKVDLYIGIDNLNALSGIILKKIGKVNKVVYYVIDYTPRRFSNRALNMLYHWVEKTAAREADKIWNISQRIADVHIKQVTSQNKNLVVPVGVFEKRFPKMADREIDRNRIVILSALLKDKGIQLAIETMADLVKINPQLELHIIGEGTYEKELKVESGKWKVGKHVKFLGLMQPEEFIPYMSKCGVALAPYLDNPNSISYFCDPTKIKEYLAAGLPVITTNVPWIAEEIEKRPMGIVVEHEKEALKKAIIKMSTDNSFRNLCRKNAIEFMKDFSWNRIYKKAFTQTFNA